MHVIPPFWSNRKPVNVQALERATEIAQGLAACHLAGISAFVPIVADTPRRQDVAVFQCATHGYNLFDASMDLVYQGRFDVAAYLFRALRDTHDWILVVHDDEAAAEKYLNFDTEFKIGEAKKALVQRLRQTDCETADSLEDVLRMGDRWYQSLSHASEKHFQFLLATDGDGLLIPALGGMGDALGAVSFGRAILADEAALLLALSVALGSRVNDAWHDQAAHLHSLVRDWVTSAPRDGNDP